MTMPSLRQALARPLTKSIPAGTRVRQVAASFTECWPVVAKWAIYLAICGYFVSSRSEPAEPAVKQMLVLVQIFGLFALSIAPVIWGTVPSAAGLVSRFLKGLAIYTMALWLLGRSGDDFYTWALANPNDAAVGIVSFAIVWIIIRFSVWPSDGLESIARSSGAVAGSSGAVAGAVAGISRMPTVRDNQYTAAHEAGHALVYAALGRLPPNLKLAINDRPDHRGALGFVTGIRSQHQLDQQTFAEWYMLVFLAGKMGESELLGESTLGSCNDHARWLNVARQYLANHCKGMFYAEPQNEFEQQRNEAKLEALQAEQMALLSRLFDMNADILKALAAFLLEKRSLTRNELIPFLSQVQLPPEFPMPFGPFDEFSHVWPDEAAAAQ